MTRLVCPIKGCGKVYEGWLDISAKKRLSGHLTGFHLLKGEAYQKAMAEAIKRATEEQGFTRLRLTEKGHEVLKELGLRP